VGPERTVQASRCRTSLAINGRPSSRQQRHVDPTVHHYPESGAEAEATQYIGMSAAWLKKSRTQRFRDGVDAAHSANRCQADCLSAVHRAPTRSRAMSAAKTHGGSFLSARIDKTGH
jgi:hypothetical protein